MKPNIYIIMWILFCFSNTILLAETYKVGPDRTYTTLQDVTAILAPGDIVEVDGDATYPSGVELTVSGTEENRITIRGIRINGKRPIITGGNRFCIEVKAGMDYITIESFELTGSTKSIVGVYGHGIVIRDCHIHDGPAEGILGYGLDTGTLLLEFTEINNCGDGEYKHQIYMGTDEYSHPGAVFRMQYCYLHDANGGNNVKSRAERNEFYFNWIEGAGLHSLELIGPSASDNPNVEVDTKREDSDLVGNVIICTPTRACARIGADDKVRPTKGRYRFVNNTFILTGRGDVIRSYGLVETVEMHNNVIYNKTDANETRVINDNDGNWVKGRLVTGSNNWVQVGSINVPGTGEWEGTITGSDPGFIDIGSNNVQLISGSPLVDKGNISPETFEIYPFPNPLFPPAKMPPLHMIQLPGEETFRPPFGIIDIGAYEYGGTGCNYSINSNYENFDVSGGIGSVTVTAIAGCDWTAASHASWITITSGNSGTGSGIINYSVAENTGGYRDGTMTIAGETFIVVQGGINCSYSLSPTNAGVAVGGGTGDIYVTASGTCAWTALSNDKWITITSVSSGSGDGVLNFSVEENPGMVRTGTITIEGEIFTITQEGVAPGPENMFGNKTGNGDYGGSNMDMGTVFRSSVPGSITAIRVFGVTGEEGSHTARIWENSTNTVIGGPYIIDYTGNNSWVEYILPSVISIEANKDYTVTVSTGFESGDRHYYAVLWDDFNKAGNNWNHLSWPANAGVWTSSLGTRPTYGTGKNFLRDIWFTSSESVGIDMIASKVPYQFNLSQNYPNPFNPTTVISYKLKVRSEVVLKIFDILGREITVLVNEAKNAGNYTVEWNGENLSGQKVGSGVYFYQIKTNNGFVETKKMILMK